MSRTVSLASMLEQINGLRGTRDITPWEDGFIKSAYGWFQSTGKKDSTSLTSKQAATVEEIWKRHFA